MQPSDSYQVMNEDVEVRMKEIADLIGPALPKGWGFNLMIFDFKPDRKPGSLFYISNANRDDMVVMMQDFINRNKNGDLT